MLGYTVLYGMCDIQSIWIRYCTSSLLYYTVLCMYTGCRCWCLHHCIRIVRCIPVTRKQWHIYTYNESIQNRYDMLYHCIPITPSITILPWQYNTEVYVTYSTVPMVVWMWVWVWVGVVNPQWMLEDFMSNNEILLVWMMYCSLLYCHIESS
jgi:hypothetical protein